MVVIVIAIVVLLVGVALVVGGRSDTGLHSFASKLACTVLPPTVRVFVAVALAVIVAVTG